MRDHKQKKVLIFAIFLVFTALMWLLFSPFGYLRLRRVKKDNRELGRRITAMEKENKKMRREADCLAGDRKCFDLLARRKFGLVGKNELIIVLPTKKKK